MPGSLSYVGELGAPGGTLLMRYSGDDVVHTFDGNEWSMLDVPPGTISAFGQSQENFVVMTEEGLVWQVGGRERRIGYIHPGNGFALGHPSFRTVIFRDDSFIVSSSSSRFASTVSCVAF